MIDSYRNGNDDECEEDGDEDKEDERRLGKRKGDYVALCESCQ